MYSTLFITFLVITLTNGESRLITSHYKAVNFAREIKGGRLHGSVIREIEVILRVLVDYIVWKKVHVGHTTLDPVKTRRCLNVN